MAIYRATGVVLKTIKLGESDRIITLCTRERGKVRAVAKGVRKTKSKFGARLEPTSHVVLQCYEGRNLDTINQVEAIDMFRNVREDFDRLRRAMAMLEAVDAVAQEEANPRLYSMLVGALGSLDKENSPLICAAFYLKLLSAEGVGPIVRECAVCGAQDSLVAFDFVQGGALCHQHRSGMAVSQEAMRLMQRILGGDMNQALKQAASPATYEVEQLADVATELHLERRLKSRRILDHA